MHFDRFFDSLWNKLRRRKPITRPVASPPQVPWDDWDLDPIFFSALSRWTRKHPESSLDHIFDNICVGIDMGNDLLQIIPNSPFPARGLIGALAHLVKLGVTIAKATKDVQAFAKDIVHWVGEVKTVFEHGGGGRFITKTRKIYLAEMRALIEEICIWATARLEDGRWSRIGHGLFIEKEINEFKSRMNSARTLCIDLSVINISHGQDAIIRSIGNLIEIIKQTQTAQLEIILDKLDAQEEERKKAEARRQFLSQILSKRAVSNTAYDDQGKNPCDSDTRIDILAEIKKWVYDISDGAQSFLWLTGDPGSGKSAITASVARECNDADILWAQFFINRNIGNTTNPASYFPSIARQLADRSPDVATSVYGALKGQPSLMDDISERQAGKLFVDSLKVASSTDISKPVVVIIDGLDETDPTRLRTTAEIFSRALVGLPRNTKVFISSRTEDDIRSPFSATFTVNHVKHIHLDTSAESSIRDVSVFLARNVIEVAERNNLNVEEWPGQERMRGLCDQASGLFIWAVTTMKFIQDQVAAEGKECLDDVLDLLNSKGMGDINTLYGKILDLAHRNQSDPWVFERFRRIVGCIVVLQQPLCIADMKSLLGLQKTATSEPVDIEHHVRRLRTVLVAGADAIDGETVPRLHKSFFEYITSDRAHCLFRINEDHAHAEVAAQCLRQMVCLGKKNGETTTGGRFPSPLRYACRFWTSHLPAGRAASVVVAGRLELPELMELFRFASNDGVQPLSTHVVFTTDGNQIISSSDQVILIWDATPGAQIESPLKGHTRSVYSVTFSPDGKQIISGSVDHTLRLWDVSSGQAIGSPFEGHTDYVRSVAFSPDGKKCISGSDDHTLRLWDPSSSQPIGSPFEDHASVFAVAFSPDGKKVISGSSDCILRLWDVSCRQVIQPPFEGHTGSVWSVAFSPDGKKIISGSSDHTIRLWDAMNGQAVGSHFQGHASHVRSVVFSPDGKTVISGSEDCTIRIWDVSSGQTIKSPIKRHTGHVWSVAFSPDGKTIISGSADGTLRLWDVASGRIIGSSFKGHTSFVSSVAFSPDRKQIVSGSGDSSLRLWDVASGKTVGFPIKVHNTGTIASICVSPNGRTIVSASLDNIVCVWDTQTRPPTGSPLNAKIKAVISLTFSPDGSQFAAASLHGSVCLFDAESRRLLSSYSKDCINRLSSVNFSSDGKQLMMFSVEGTTHTWDASTGQSLETSQPFNISLFNSSRFTLCGNNDKPLLQLFPVDNPNFGYWAYIDNTLIRRDRNGSTTVLDMSDFKRKWKVSLGKQNAEENA